MSKKSKGNDRQRTIAKWLRKQGLEAEVVRNTQWNHGDYFGVADIIAINPEYWVIIQVKSGGTHGAITTLKEKVMPPDTVKLVAARYGAKQNKKAYKAYWKIINVVNNKRFEVLEEDLDNILFRDLL